MTPDDIKSARIAAAMTQTAAGASVGGTLRTWQDWEAGKRPMPVAAWELFLLHTDQHPTHRLVERKLTSGFPTPPAGSKPRS